MDFSILFPLNSDSFLISGGYILVVILAAAFVMWFLIIERYWYFFFGQKNLAAMISEQWNLVQSKHSRQGHAIRLYHISKFRCQAEVKLGMIKTLINISMLLGLLGTITGMIQVFEGVAASASNNVQLMAAGVSRTVIPAMSGLVVALSGLYFSAQLQHRATREIRKLSDTLEIE